MQQIKLLDKKYVTKRYEKLISNCDRALAQAETDWAIAYWKGVKEKLKKNMSSLGLLKESRLVH
jgi:hypothetical protein